MPGPLPLPAVPAEITPAWLTTVLRNAGVVERATVAEAAWEPIGGERGFTGVLARVSLRYDAGESDEGAPRSLVAKFPMAPRVASSAYRDAQERDPIARRHYYDRCAREVRFYWEIARLGQIPAPLAYYVAADADTRRIVLLLEDVASARPGDALAGCSADEAALVVETIAPFHARWWSGRGAAALPTWPPRWGGDPGVRQEQYNQRIGPFRERFGRQIPAPVHDLLEGLRTACAEVLVALTRAPATLVHADLHLDNLLFNPPGAVAPVVVLDWQGIARGPGVADLALFLVGALAVNQRRAAEDELIRRYHTLLVEHGVAGYALDQLREDYRLALLWHLAVVVVWLASVDFDHLAGRERALTEAALGDGRLLAALVDNDVRALLSHLPR